MDNLVSIIIVAKGGEGSPVGLVEFALEFNPVQTQGVQKALHEIHPNYNKKMHHEEEEGAEDDQGGPHHRVNVPGERPPENHLKKNLR